MNEEVNKNNEKQTNSLEEQRQLLNQAEQVAEVFRKLDGEIKFSSRDFENRFNVLQEQVKKWSDAINSASKELDEKIANLAQETTVLTTLPEKIGKYLDRIIPAISAEIQKRNFQEFEQTISDCFKSVAQLEGMIQSVNRNMLEANHQAFKKKVLSGVLILSITVFSSTILTYGIMRLFPTKFSIDAKGEVNIHGGNISVWGTGKNNVPIKQKGKSY